MKPKNNRIIGIIGGMGPMAGVLLQNLIIEATPAKTDQDHFRVICFTNPAIPDRTQSLQSDNGKSYVTAIRETARALIHAGATLLVIPCNTAHSRLKEIKQGLDTPFVNIVETAIQEVVRRYGPARKIGLLATDATITNGIYQSAGKAFNFEFLIPAPSDQKEITRVIYDTKQGIYALTELLPIINRLVEQNAEIIILGCTELSLYYSEISQINRPVICPLRAIAHVLTRNK